MGKSIVIADDHAFTIDGMKSALVEFTNFDIVGSARNGIEAIALIKKFSPDIAVIDFSMPEVTGQEAFIEARRWSPETKFVIITGNNSPVRLSELIDSGLNGVLLKTMAPKEICDALKQIADGENYVASDVEKLVGELKKSEALTAREVEVLQAISRGNSNAQIAENLCVSPKTIDSHRTSLMKKMGVHTTAALLVRAMRDGLIDV